MSTNPIVSFNVDLSGNSATASVAQLAFPGDVPNGLLLGSGYLQLTLLKNNLYLTNSGIISTLTTNASGIIISTTATASTQIDSGHITSRAQTNAGWKNGGIVTLTASCLGVSRTFNFNTTTAVTAGYAYSNTNLGHLMSAIIAQAISGKSPTNLTTHGISDPTGTTANTIRTTLCTQISNALATQAVQNALLQLVLQSSGAVLQPITSASTSSNYKLSLNNNTALPSIISLAGVLQNVRIDVSFYGTSRPLVFTSIPLWIDLV